LTVAKEKTDLIRKHSAVLVAKLAAKSEECKKAMHANHGSEIIMSLGGALVGQK